MFTELREKYRKEIFKILSRQSSEIRIEDIKTDCPLEVGKGDIAVPFFMFARNLKKSPQMIAESVRNELEKCSRKALMLERIEVVNGYLNIYLDKNRLADAEFQKMNKSPEDFGKSDCFKKEKIMVEFSCPNTNKPLHLGHIRNDALGNSISNLLKFCSADVFKVNLVNDRGIHICKSMYMYKKNGKGRTPESEKIKPDKFVADYYVSYNEFEKEAEEEAKSGTSEMLRLWESGDKETRALWQKMRKWALDGIEETYRKTNIVFDRTYYESELYTEGKKEVMKGLEKGVFRKDKSGAVMADVDGKEKVLLRSDGTSIYLTQDIGTAIKRHSDYPYTSCIYVVGNEQIDHFKTLFAVLNMLGYKWSEKLYHLAYGMVNLESGRMKTRDGTVVDADDLLESLKNLSLEVMSDDIKDEKVRRKTAESVSLGALNYFLLSVSPSRDMIFKPKESLSFSGDTGPYLQYTAARITSILKKAGKTDFKNLTFSSLNSDDEKQLVFYISYFQYCIEKSARSYDPSFLCSYTYNLCKIFSHFYHDTPILKADEKVRKEKLALAVMILNVLKKALGILGIPYLEEM